MTEREEFHESGDRRRDAAERLASNADRFAEISDQGASVHDEMASTEGHPLREAARRHAEVDRRAARDARADGERFRKNARDGD